MELAGKGLAGAWLYMEDIDDSTCQEDSNKVLFSFRYCCFSGMLCFLKKPNWVAAFVTEHTVIKLLSCCLKEEEKNFPKAQKPQ